MRWAEKKRGSSSFPPSTGPSRPPTRNGRSACSTPRIRSSRRGCSISRTSCEYKPGLATIEDINRVHICVPDAKQRHHRIAPHLGGRRHHGGREGAHRRGRQRLRPGPARPATTRCASSTAPAASATSTSRPIMIEYIRQHYGPKRIAIVDTDCHHGDGTQDIYWNDPDTLCISIHQDGRTLYPGTGFPDEFGGPNALGTTINIPLPPETSDEGFLYVLEELILPILGRIQAGSDHQLRRPGQPLHRPDHQHALLRPGLCPAQRAAQPAHRRARGRLLHREGPALRQRRDHPGHGRPRLQPRPRTGLQPRIASASPARSPKYIRETSKDILDLWKKRESFKAGIVKGAKYVRRNRNIYYDTDGIREQQEETVRICDDCGGLVIAIESMAEHREPDLRRHHPEPQLRFVQARGRESLREHQQGQAGSALPVLPGPGQGCLRRQVTGKNGVPGVTWNNGHGWEIRNFALRKTFKLPELFHHPVAPFSCLTPRPCSINNGAK